MCTSDDVSIRRLYMQEKMINKYIAKNHSGSVFTDSELKVIKDGDMDEMISTFFDLSNNYYKKQMQSAFNILNQYMSGDVELESIAYLKEYTGKFVGCQLMDGDIDVFLGIAGDDKDLLCVASAFSQEELQEFDADAYDALCELINVMNGAYATRLSGEEKIELSLHPPVFYTNTSIKAEVGLYIVTFSMNRHKFNLLMAADDKIKLIA